MFDERSVEVAVEGDGHCRGRRQPRGPIPRCLKQFQHWRVDQLATRKPPEERPGGRELAQVGGLIVPVGEYVPQFARRRVPVVAEVAGAHDESTARRAEQKHQLGVGSAWMTKWSRDVRLVGEAMTLTRAGGFTEGLRQLLLIREDDPQRDWASWLIRWVSKKVRLAPNVQMSAVVHSPWRSRERRQQVGEWSSLARFPPTPVCRGRLFEDAAGQVSAAEKGPS